ncbi:MAG: hypothetical protein AM1032_000355 [Mycoplasmataceae bacterium]|nr:MAG: hypothetical protein AM1032_000355 [Mycoplasmataceae bacterium]
MEKNENQTLENWSELGEPFLDFDEEITQSWIETCFTIETAKEWLENKDDFDFRWNYIIYWIINEKNITIDDFKKLDEDQKENLTEQFNQHFIDKNLTFCSWCFKCLEKSSMHIIEFEKNLNFCSENCQNRRNNYFEQKQLDEKAEISRKIIFSSIAFTTIIAILILIISIFRKSEKSLKNIQK